jgi:hypothetical protein
MRAVAVALAAAAHTASRPRAGAELQQANIVEVHDFNPGRRQQDDRRPTRRHHDQAWALSGDTTVQRPELCRAHARWAALALDEPRPVPMEWPALAPKGASGPFAETVRAG